MNYWWNNIHKIPNGKRNSNNIIAIRCESNNILILILLFTIYKSKELPINNSIIEYNIATEDEWE